MGKGTMGELCYFDTHTHYNDRRFEADLTEVLRKVRKTGVLRNTIIGYDLESSRLAVRIAEAQRVAEGKKSTEMKHTPKDGTEAGGNTPDKGLEGSDEEQDAPDKRQREADVRSAEAHGIAEKLQHRDAAGCEDAPWHTVAVGIHPLHTGDAEEEDLIRLEILAEDETVVAIGEIGLDYHRKEPEVTPDKETQQRFFRKQLRIARRA